ncbi:preprotein translocase subunit SecE [Corynebacterium sp. 320]|uniref:preprotein translocase subunit SecE n=1 Tax=Corynebacterium TaxID=1716 RepID=UPI00125CD255|nr:MULTISPECIES: preprotein translocase subunit SecE [Corynebacterium]KAB1503201.1 preprotein translocase subunit SecE [Corynebacterium sp. 320]KAB1550586.1 preprotein translocase subunit SecE [Corynebacterium sp. 321]KAB1550947.1 preprotein translocase subunit SecE [Corynebacterium sp. 319]KAB3526998.1 preprotein translocase subunit SecE [Corynebacterium sp. 250]KAB3538490.1 preprotein translocase subunit SecE [Corynebacterium sp. 366]
MSETPNTPIADGGNLRPTGKRQRAGEATTARATSAQKAPEVVETRRNPFSAIVDFLRGVVSEMGKVIWPTGREMVNYTIIVLLFLVFTTALVGGVDWVSNFALQKIFH